MKTGRQKPCQVETYSDRLEALFFAIFGPSGELFDIDLIWMSCPIFSFLQDPLWFFSPMFLDSQRQERLYLKFFEDHQRVRRLKGEE